MEAARESRSASVRARLNHPVIDSDGHFVEIVPLFLDYLKSEGGGGIVDRFRQASRQNFAYFRMSAAERKEWHASRPPWWVLAARNTRDLATAMFPELLYERLPEMGIDFSVLYPTLGLLFLHMEDPEVRRASCRALNKLNAELFRDYADRLTPAALIPMDSPDEALGELQHAIGTLGLKAALMPSYVRRPVPALSGKFSEATQYTTWLDSFGIDSEYDYDPVWGRCVELGVAPTFHSLHMGIGSRTSPSNYMYNHLGHFAAAGDAVCKALFMGGVTRRFPRLRFAFLEDGTAWASTLYNDLIGHWRKRNREAVQNYNPDRMNREQFVELFGRFAPPILRERHPSLISQPLRALPQALGSVTAKPGTEDEWARCEISRAEDIADLFVRAFFFGCEADDPGNASAFDAKRNTFGARLGAIFSSDIGHWDVPDMREVCEEAWELVEHSVISEQDFRDFVFVNPVRLWTETNPKFFHGTAVESAVAKLLGP